MKNSTAIYIHAGFKNILKFMTSVFMAQTFHEFLKASHIREAADIPTARATDG